MTIWKAPLVLAVLVFGFTGALAAQTVTAFNTGEVTTGMTKQCFYDALGNGYTRTIGSIHLCPLSIQVQLSPTPAPEPETRTVTAFMTGEVTTGMTKQCFYDAFGNQYTRTIGSIDLCPLNIRVKPPLTGRAEASRTAEGHPASTLSQRLHHPSKILARNFAE